MRTTGGRVHQFTIGDRLRKAREEAGFDQRGFEAASGISRATISAYELGKSTPKRPYVSIWANVTATDETWLLTGEVTQPSSDTETGGEGNDPVYDVRTSENASRNDIESGTNSPEPPRSGWGPLT